MGGMKLFLLRPLDGLPEDRSKNPWRPWYDKAFGFVVRAEDESAARALAGGDAGDEAGRDYNAGTSRERPNPWLDAALSSCVELTPEGAAEVVIRDFAAA